MAVRFFKKKDIKGITLKYRSVQNWSNLHEIQGLLFFAQRLEEMLFDYTMDTYKAPALNSYLLCREALTLIYLIETNLIDKNNLSHVLEELKYTIGRDRVAKSLMDFDIDSYIEHIEPKHINIKKTKTRLKILLNQLTEDSYIDKTKSFLFEAISENRKDDIFDYSRIFVTALLNFGYHPKYLYNISKQFFFYGNTIDSNDKFYDFISSLNKNRTKYSIIFRADRLFSEIKDSCTSFGISILDNPNEFSEYISRHNFKLSGDKVYLSANDIEAYDPFSARERANNALENIQKAFVLFHHKERVSWDDAALIVDSESGKSVISGAPISPMLKGIDMRPQKAASRLNTFLNDFTLNSHDKIFSVLNLHGLAVSNDSLENQLLNIWICMETLAPSDANSSKSKINNIISKIKPALMLGYHSRLIDRLLLDFLLWNQTVFKKFLHRIDGDNTKYRLLFLLILPEYEALREDLKTEFQDFALLRNRFFKLSGLLSDTKKIRKNLLRHEQRVECQIRRIYRTRNLIVHSGSIPSYANILVENAHDYLDTLLSEIIALASDGFRANTLNECFDIMQMNYEKHMKFLNNEKVVCNKSNYKEIIFPNKSNAVSSPDAKGLGS